MLTRLFRLTDKFSNAFLKLVVWLGITLLEQVTELRQTTEESVVDLYMGTKQTVDAMAQSSKDAYDATDRRRRSLMAQRAAIVTTDGGTIQPAVIEDPLVRQNRTLSVFAVVLMLALIAIVLWATSQNIGGQTAGVPDAGAFLPRNTAAPTAPSFPTSQPSATPVPQPLNWRGTLAFSLRHDGQEDLFAIQRGDTAPRRLTNSPADDRDPAWSPDGRTLAFVSNRDGPFELYIMDVIDKQVRRLTFTSAYEGAPTWSPDGAFIAYEVYDNTANNLDIYIVAVDGSGPCGQPCRVTRQSGPDFEAAWMPQTDAEGGGRRIAYTSIRNGVQDIYVIDLDNPADESALNLTNTPNIDENYPAWSPNGQYVAYSGRVDGLNGVFYRAVEDPAQEFAVGRGEMPVWNPQDGSSLFYITQPRPNQSQIVGADPNALGGGGDLRTLDGVAADLDWTVAEPVFEGVTASYSPLYEEAAAPSDDGRYGLANLPGVEAGDPFLNVRVDDSFNALRLQVLDATGRDYLAELEDAFWRLDRLPETGQPRFNWHYAGRAFALNRNLVLQGNPTPMVVVREDREIGTYWRVYLRVAEQYQNGERGEPLRAVPWDFAARTSGDDLEAYERGGRRMRNVPGGYYVDLTQLAADYGWYPLPADRTWRQNFAGILFWVFAKTDGLTWRDAMRELYTEAELNRFGGTPQPVENTPTLPVFPTGTPTSEPQRSPTPVPPDQQ